MGFSICWFAVPEKNSAAFCAYFGLSPTGEKVDVPDCPIAMGKLDTGWTLIWYDKYNCPFISENDLSEVSRSYDVVHCSVEEHVMTSSAELWSGGRRKWAISHAAENGPLDLQLEGRPPDCFQSIKERKESGQSAEGENHADHIFDVPLCVAEAIVGFKHDERYVHMPENLFHVMTRSETKRGFFARFIGRKQKG